MVGIPDTRATNSALGGTLKRFSEYFLLKLTEKTEVSLSRTKACRSCREDNFAPAQKGEKAAVDLVRFLHSELMVA